MSGKASISQSSSALAGPFNKTSGTCTCACIGSFFPSTVFETLTTLSVVVTVVLGGGGGGGAGTERGIP